MQVYISPVARAGGSGGGVGWEVTKVRGSGRRFSCRSVLPTVLVAGILLPFLFIRAAFLALDAGASICPSIRCFGWRIGPRLMWGSNSSMQEIMEQLKRAYLDGADGRVGTSLDPDLIQTAPESFDDLIAEMSSASFSQHLDIQAFVLRTKAMLLKMEQRVQSARLQASFFGHLASVGIPKNMNCFNLKLAEEYLVNAIARSSLPPAEYSSRLTSNSYIHIALITDNVLAAAVAVSSTLTNSADPKNLVFHIVTDKQTYTAMHAWFALHPIDPAIVEVKGLHQFEFGYGVNTLIKNTVEEIHRSLSGYRYYRGADEDLRRLLAMNPSTFLLLNYLRIHLPELFPKLRKVVLLDDDVIIQRDMTPLWDLHLNGKIIGAVNVQGNDELGDQLCVGKKLDGYLNFSNPILSALGLPKDQCAWSEGMNIVNLRAWRRTNITQTYQYWLKMNRESGFTLWQIGWLPPALVAFHGQVHSIEHSWHLPGLGSRIPDAYLLDSSAVLHFSGPRKPWLDIADPDLRSIWRSYLNKSDEFLSSCRVV